MKATMGCYLFAQFIRHFNVLGHDKDGLGRIWAVSTFYNNMCVFSTEVLFLIVKRKKHELAAYSY
jgi:hypothetical protein